MAADEDFFKKIYGYSYCDKDFLNVVVRKLVKVGRKDIIEKYNQWFAGYQEQRDKELKEVAHWYVKRLDDWYEREVKKCNSKKQTIETTRSKWLNTQIQHLANIKTMGI